MTQVPGAAWCRAAVPVVPEFASTPDSPAADRTATEAMPSITPEARQFAADMTEANRMPFGALVLHHARALSALRAVWKSRRGWQDEADEAHARIAELEVVQDALIGQLRDSRARVTALKAALAGMRDGAGR